jgi:hypothetical protein
MTIMDIILDCLGTLNEGLVLNWRHKMDGN